MKALLQATWVNLFEPDRTETPGEVVFYRIFEVVMLYWTLLFGWEWGLYLPNISDVVLPLGIARFIDISFMFENGLGVWNAVLMTAMAAVAFFRLHRWAYAVLALAFHFQYAARYSLGEISHGSNVIGLAILAMAVATLAFRDRKDVRRFALGLTLFFLGWGYFTAAMSKLIATGPMWVSGDHMWMWIQERTVDVYSKFGAPDVNMLQQLLLDWYPLATMVLAFGLITEFCGPLIWYRKTRPFIMTFMIIMHVGILLSMRINFPANNAILLVLAYPWADWLDAWFRSRGWYERLHELSGRLS